MQNLLEQLSDKVNITISKSDLMEFAQFLIDETLKNTQPSQKSVLNLEEAVEFCGLTVRTIYKKTSLGDIPHYKQAGKLFFRREELEGWLTEKGGFYKPDISAAGSTYSMLHKSKNK